MQATHPHPHPTVAKAAVRSKAVVLLLMIYCLMCFPLFVGVLCLCLFCSAIFCVHSSFSIILKRKRKLIALCVLSYRCYYTRYVVLTHGAVGWSAVCAVVLSDHTHLLFRLTGIRQILSTLTFESKFMTEIGNPFCYVNIIANHFA